MKVTLLANAASIHTIRWANGLSRAGHEVSIISQKPALESLNPEVRTYIFRNYGVVGYFLMVPRVRKLLARIAPDIVNAHYASGYGVTARLSGYHPYILSVWGSDVYDFPYKSPLHKWFIRGNLKAADKVASTSHCMAEQVRKLMPGIGELAITPFGVDVEKFSVDRLCLSGEPGKVVIGTVKTMSPKYGIDTLIEAFAILNNRFVKLGAKNALSLELRLVGGGKQLEELEALSHSLGIAKQVKFLGQVEHEKVPEELSKLDIYVALSRLDSESFGVAILEASAAGKPVVVSDVGGLPEVTLDGKTGFVVPRDNPQATANVIERLVLDSALRESLGAVGRRHVEQSYSWNACIKTMVKLYERVIQNERESKNDT